MLNKSLLMGLAVAGLLTATLMSRSGGALPGSSGIPSDAARAAPSCGSCHGVFTTKRPKVIVTPDALLLKPGQMISVLINHSGGVTLSGGFAAEVTAGRFTAGSRSQVNFDGSKITHRARSNNWMPGYTAPATPGPVEMYTVVNSVNRNGATSGDSYSFRGFSKADTVSTALHLYVLADGVELLGNGCTDGFRNQAVLGAAEVPSVGNANFGFELVGAAPGVIASLLVNINSASFQPIDLTPFGIDGCTLYVERPLLVHTVTSTGSAKRAEGTGFFSMPVPNIPTLAGKTVDVQCVFVDPSAPFVGRIAPITLTNALHVVIQ